MKSILLTLLFVSITSLTFSQEVKYGVRAGMNISNLDFDPDPTFKNQHRNGFVFGGFVDYEFSEKFSILAEIQYSAEGGKGESIRADYIQLPIFFKFPVAEKLSLGVGPMVSLKTWEDTDGFSTFTFSGVAGAEYMITDELFVDARFYYGLTNILDEDLTSVEATNSAIQIGFGIKI